MSNDHRNTPEEVLVHIRRFGAIWLDPCSNATSTVGATKSYDVHSDGLTQSWNRPTPPPGWQKDEPTPLVFVNGTWSNLLPWAEKAAREHNAHGIEVLFWCPVYPETAWFKVLWAHCMAVCFWGKRVHHPDPEQPDKNTGSMWPTALVYFGTDFDRFYRVFCTEGQVAVPINDRQQELTL